jgi:hypothetical protein
VTQFHPVIMPGGHDHRNKKVLGVKCPAAHAFGA